MDRRPPNPRRLSRQLFNKPKPDIEPLFNRAKNVPKFAVGDEEVSPALRSDLGLIKVRPGEDFITYDLFSKALKEGRIPFEYEDSKKGFEEFRRSFLDRRANRSRLAELAHRHRFRPQYGHYIQEARDAIDEYEDLPLLRQETKGMTRAEKAKLFADDRARMDLMDEDIPFSMKTEQRKKLATKLAESREGMSRAQNRKLGRVIRDGKTGPLTRTRKEPFTENEMRNVYKYEVYEPKRYDYKENEGTLKYIYGKELGDRDLKQERLKLRGEYDVLRERMEEIEKRYIDIHKENKEIVKDIKTSEDEDGYFAHRFVEFHKNPTSMDIYSAGTYDRIAENKKAFAERGIVTSLNPLRDKHDRTDRGEVIPKALMENEYLRSDDNVRIPAGLNVKLTPEQRKLFERNAGKSKELRKDYDKMFREMEKVKREYKNLADDRADKPEREYKEVERKFNTREGLNEAIKEMRELTKGKALFSLNTTRDAKERESSYDKNYEEYKKGSKEYNELADKFVERFEEGYNYGKGRTNVVIPNTPFMKYEVVGDFRDVEDEDDDRDDRYYWTTPKYKLKKVPEAIRATPQRPAMYQYRGRRDFYHSDRHDRLNPNAKRDYSKDYIGKKPLSVLTDEDEVNKFLEEEGMLKYTHGNKFKSEKKVPKANLKLTGKEPVVRDIEIGVDMEEIPKSEKRGFLTYKKTGEEFEEVMSRNEKYKEDGMTNFFLKDGKVVKRVYHGKRKRPIKKVRRVKRLGVDMMGNPDFVMRVGKGKGRRIFHLDEAKDKGWKEVERGKYAKQSANWKSLDVDTTPKEQLQLRGLRDRRTGGGRLIGRGRLDPRRIDRSKEYKSARQEALIQMRINETAGVRDAKSKAEKEIKNIRISEAQKALNLKLQKETAEKTAEGLKQKNKGLVHSYNVNVRNQTAATLLGSDPEELNKILKKGGGLALIKTMIRKGEITDASTIGQLNTSTKQKENLLRLLNEGGDFVEGQEYFYRTLDDFGRTIVQRGYLNKGGERKKNLELMKITTNEDGTSTTERFIVPKSQILAPDDYTTTTTSGKKQQQVPPTLTDFELDVFGGDAPEPKPANVVVQQDPKTGVKSLVKTKGAGIADPSPRPNQSLLSTLQQSDEFDTMGGDLEITPLDPLPFSTSEEEEETFEFGGDAPVEPEPEVKEPTPYGIKPKSGGEIPLDDSLTLATGEADDIANVLAGGNYSVLGSPRLGEVVQKLKKTLGQKPPDGSELEGLLAEAEASAPAPGESTIDEILSPKPPKKVSIAEEIAATFSPEQTTLGEKKPANLVPMDWKGNESSVPDAVLKENWDFRGRGLKSRLGEGGTQEVPEGYTAIWTTKYADRANQTALLVNEADIYYLVRGLRGVGIRNDKGKLRPITDASLKAFYRKTLENIRNGKKETPFNDKQLLRAFDMIDPAEEPESD